MDRPRALIIGGSLGGLFAANLLRAVGWDVAIFERTRGDLAGRGAGLGTRAELFDVMRRAGIDLDASIGAEVCSRIGLRRDGATICEVPIRSVTTAWDRIYQALRAALPEDCHHAGMQLHRFAQDGRKVVASFADGRSAEGDLLVGADGIHSTVRRQLLPDLAPRYAGYISWRGVVGDDAGRLDPVVLRHMTFGFPAGELAITVPAPANRAAGDAPPRCNFSWFRPVDDPTTLRAMCTDASGHCHGDSIPPPLIRPELVDAAKADADALLAPQIAAVIARAERPLLQPIFDLESPRMRFGRVVLLGDAAFVARPHVGTGVTKAALDAQCLADVLRAEDHDVDTALPRYDAARRPFGTWLVARGRYLGAWLEAETGGSEMAAVWRDRGPESLIREFGGAGVIDGVAADRWGP
jgi:2-polyprenyl-6-methoxyphenol hydroxylase-like FAD-dependent oxidoreductase